MYQSQLGRENPTDQLSFWQDKRNLIFLSAVLVISFAVYLPCLQYGFVNWDDSENIYKNPDIINISDCGSLCISVKNIFSTYFHGNYNPLTITTFAI